MFLIDQINLGYFIEGHLVTISAYFLFILSIQKRHLKFLIRGGGGGVQYIIKNMPIHPKVLYLHAL